MNSTRFQFLKKLKQYGIKNNIPNISENTAHMLQFFIHMKKAKSVLEIGCANGYSTIWIADALEALRGDMVTYDVSEPSFKEAIQNAEEAGVSHLIDFRFGDAKELLKDSSEKFDIIFLDARKAHYHIFWECIKPLMKDDTIVIVDDVIKFQAKTGPFNEAIEKEEDYESIIIPVDEDDGLMLIQRKSLANSL